MLRIESQVKEQLLVLECTVGMRTSLGICSCKKPYVCCSARRYSASFVLLTAGSSGAFLGFIYLLTEVVPSKVFERAAAPFMWLGMNSIAVYVGDEILEKAVPWIYWGDREVHLLSAVEGVFKRVFGGGTASDLALAAADVAFWMAVAGWLHRKRWYARV